MLTTHRIREHFESLELDRLRAEVKELETRIQELQSELIQCKATNNPDSNPQPSQTDSP